MSNSTISSSSLLDDLMWRGLIHDSTDLGLLREHLDTAPRSFYVGFDPSAPSLTIGNLLAMMLVIRGALAGLKAVVLLGGGTGLIGDPSGKSTERTLLSIEDAHQNVIRHRDLMSAIFRRVLRPEQMPKFVDNFEWLGEIKAIEFLRDVGKYFPIAEMIRRDSVRRRLSNPDEGLSYTEFSYALLQAYDFMKLCADYKVTIQFGASDQWGNIVAGIDYVRRILNESVHAVTCPLLLRNDGTKFGKTEKGAIWISADRTSPYELYQFLINLADDEARKFALFFSLETRENLEKLFAEHTKMASERKLQRHLAREITTLIHGSQASEKSETASQALFNGDISSLDIETFNNIFGNAPSVQLEIKHLDGNGTNIVDLLVMVELASSKRQAREYIANGAINVNGKVINGENKMSRMNLLHDAIILLRRGKREWRVVRFI